MAWSLDDHCILLQHRNSNLEHDFSQMVSATYCHLFRSLQATEIEKLKGKTFQYDRAWHYLQK